MKGSKPAQKVEVIDSPALDVLEVVARCDRRTGQQKQDFGQGIEDPPRLPLIRQPRKMLQKQTQTRSRNFSQGGNIEAFVHGVTPCESRTQGITSPRQS
jgi:hypothetical protein